MKSLRAPTPNLGKRFVVSRTTWLPVFSVGHIGRLTCAGRKVSSSEGEATTASSGASTKNNELDTKQHENAIDVDMQVVVPSSKAAGPQLTAATSGAGDGDWQKAPLGDWGGTVDPQGIKEPDSSGVLFFFIIIAGLSVVVHQLLRYLGAGQGGEQLARPPRGQVAIAVTSTNRARAIQPSLAASRPEASAEDGPASLADTGGRTAAGAAESRDAGDAMGSSPREGGRTEAAVATVSAAQLAAGRSGASGATDATGRSNALAGATDTEPGNETGTESESNASEQPQPVEKSISTESAKPQLTARSAVAGAATPTPAVESGAEAAVRGADSAEGAEPRRAAPASAPQAPPRADLAEKQRVVEAEAGPAAQPLLASTTASGGGRGGVGVFGGEAARGCTFSAAEQTGPGPAASADTSSSSPVQTSSPFAGASALFLGRSGGGAAPSQTEPSASTPTRLSLPAVRPEPLSRAPDSSALALLPHDSSLGSLRERAQLALRAAAAAVEASQRAAAYAAAASNAASRAAEAAERAAAAATLAQAGLERAAESAIVAAEARVAQAVEAAKDAEERAASAAAHATAYQDMSQSQADIAERAAAVPRLASPGPLSQLQQLWRSASSAFSQGTQHSNQQGQQNHNGPTDGPAGAAGGSTTSSDSVAGSGMGGSRCAGGATDAGVGVSGAGGAGTTAAETISTTVKGLLSWLGQGDGTR